MTTINWYEEVLKRKEKIIHDTQEFLRMKSVYDEKTRKQGAPMGEDITRALEYMLHKGQDDGFITKNLDGYAGHIELGNGKELVGVLCHVDVVPEGEGWTSAPYSAEIREGKIFARGAIDDKGPTMAAYYAMKIVKDLQVPLNKRVRMILGTDEESNWGCVKHYFKHEEMPDIGFAPDADFPIIYSEKGIANFFLFRDEMETQQETQEINQETEHITLVEFSSGLRVNMVPDRAKAVLKIGDVEKAKEIASLCERYFRERDGNGRISVEGHILEIQVDGVSVHGSEPEKGSNAGYLLLHFLTKIGLLAQKGFSEADQSFITFLHTYFVDDHYGKKLGIENRDQEAGSLTINVGVVKYRHGVESRIGLNLRYPMTTDYEHMNLQLKEKLDPFGYRISDMDNMLPHYVDKEHPLIKTLQGVYESQTGEKATLLSIGGGTYARSLKAGVAFGPLFPGKLETAHQKDEFVEIEDLLKATAIYAQAIFELTR
jgi:succinyl-diaminopimelate desuccinylase